MYKYICIYVYIMVSENDKAKIRELVCTIQLYGSISNIALANKVSYSLSKFNALKPHLLFLHADEIKYEGGIWRYVEPKKEEHQVIEPVA